MSNSITDKVEITVPAADDFLISETTGKVAHKSKYSNMKADMLANAQSNISVTNNARLFDCSYRLNGDYSPSDIIAGATTLTGTGGSALSAGQVILRYYTSNQQYNGLYVVQSGGAAAIRYSKANTGGLLMYSVAMPNAGTYKGKWYKCTNYAAVIDVDPVNYTEVFTPAQSLETTDSPTFAAVTLPSGDVQDQLNTSITNNARLFDCSYRLDGDYSPSDIIAGATTLTGIGSRALFAGQLVSRFHTCNQQ